ncbi:hypothetical protein Tco_1087021 [Tanacetum coccineum]
MVLSAKEAWETIEDCAQCDKQCENPTSTIFDQIIANFKAQLVGNEVVRVKMHKCLSWLDAYDKLIGDLKDKVDNLGLQSTPQVLSSFEVYTPPVTHPKEVEETRNPDRVPSFDEPEPQPQPLPSSPYLDVSIGYQRGPEPPIKPHSSDSFRMKVVDNLTIHTPPLPHVASFHPRDVYCYYHPSGGNLMGLCAKDAWETIEDYAYDEPIGDLEDKMDNLGSQRIPMEVEPLDETQLEDLGLNTCNHDIPLSSREVPSFDESEPQPQPYLVVHT